MQPSMKKRILFLLSGFVLLACSVFSFTDQIDPSGDPSAPNETANTETPADEITETQTPAAQATQPAADPTSTQTSTPIATPTVEPTPTVDPLLGDAPPKPPHEFTVLEANISVEENGIIGEVARCPGAVVQVFGLAVNETDYVLWPPDIYLAVYDGDDFITETYLGNNGPLINAPGEEMVFNSGFPDCEKLGAITSQGYQFDELTFKVKLYAKEKSDHSDLTTYLDLKIVSIEQKPNQQAGSKLDVTIRNTGTEPAIGYLNYLFYAADGSLFDGEQITIPFYETYLQPGTETVSTLYSFVEEIADYEVFIVGASGGD